MLQTNLLNQPFMSDKIAKLDALSENITKESLAEILEILKTDELSEEEFIAASEAFDTVAFLYALPQGEEEERDLKLCTLIARRMQEVEDLENELADEESLLEEAKLEREVADALLEAAAEEQKEDRQTDVDALGIVIEDAVNECVQIEEELQEVTAWISAARGLLHTEKYKELPEECLEVLFMDDEDEMEDDEEYFDDCCGEDACGNEECEGCEDCEGCDTDDTEEMESGCGASACCKA